MLERTKISRKKKEEKKGKRKITIKFVTRFFKNFEIEIEKNSRRTWRNLEQRICQNFMETRTNSSRFKETRIILQGFRGINSWGFEINNSSKIQREWINFREKSRHNFSIIEYVAYVTEKARQVYPRREQNCNFLKQARICCVSNELLILCKRALQSLIFSGSSKQVFCEFTLKVKMDKGRKKKIKETK